MHLDLPVQSRQSARETFPTQGRILLKISQEGKPVSWEGFWGLAEILFAPVWLEVSALVLGT